MTICTDWFELVSAAADDQATPAERARLDEHLAGCASCRSLLHAFEHERRRRRLAPPVAHGDLVEQVLASHAAEPAAGRASRELARRGVLAVAAVVVLVIGLAATPRRSADPPPTSELATGGQVLIDAEGRTFDEAEVEVPAGTTVEWRNTGSSTHHLVRSLDGVTIAEDLAPGRSELATFAEPGTYEFWCTIHQGMVGTVTVDA